MSGDDDALKATIERQTAAVERSTDRLDELATQVNELATGMKNLKDRVYDNYDQFRAFANRSTEDRLQLNERLAVVEQDGLTRRDIQEVMTHVIQQQQVVTRQTLVKMSITEFSGGFRRFAIGFIATGASMGGFVVLIQHILNWLH